MAFVEALEAQKQILFASRYAYMYYQSVSETFQDYSLSFTQNAKQAVSYLKKNKPSVVILSENLKELDTLKLCKAIRKSSRLAATKIILLVPDDKSLDDIQAERKAVVDIILKQSQKPSSFVTHIAKLLKASAGHETNLTTDFKTELETSNKKNVQEKNNVLKSKNLSDNTKSSIHPTPFPDAAENIYLLPEAEMQAVVEVINPPQQTLPSNQHVQNHSMESKGFAGQEVARTSISPPISPPRIPSNRPTYKRKQQDVQNINQQTSGPQTVIPNVDGETTTQSTDGTRTEPTLLTEPQTSSSHASIAQNRTSQSEAPEIIEEQKVYDASTTDSVHNSDNVYNIEATHNYNVEYPEAGDTKTIAIIEDNASIAFLEKSILERQGYNTIQISDAPQAREFVDTNFDMADLILLDLNLPGGSGFEILRRIRSFSRKPVIIVSGLKQSENIKRGLSLGAQDYLTKPMNPQELILRVSQHIKNFT